MLFLLAIWVGLLYIFVLQERNKQREGKHMNSSFKLIAKTKRGTTVILFGPAKKFLIDNFNREYISEMWVSIEIQNVFTGKTTIVK